jgi:hypothetical protein
LRQRWYARTTRRPVRQPELVFITHSPITLPGPALRAPAGRQRRDWVGL